MFLKATPKSVLPLTHANYVPLRSGRRMLWDDESMQKTIAAVEQDIPGSTNHCERLKCSTHVIAHWYRRNLLFGASIDLCLSEMLPETKFNHHSIKQLK